MRKKLLAVLAASAMLTGGTAALAVADPGPHHGNNDYGLCTAWANNENGRENGNAGEAPPFQALQDAAEENDQTVEEWCEENADHPSENGRG